MTNVETIAPRVMAKPMSKTVAISGETALFFLMKDS